MVLLLHELPDGSAHFDWMFDPVERANAAIDDAVPLHTPHDRQVQDERRLVTFRVDTRLDQSAPQPGIPITIEATRLPDHRVRYLTYEGPIDAWDSSVCGRAGADPTMGQRGCVRRVAEGVCRIDRLTADGVWLRVCFDGAAAIVIVGFRKAAHRRGSMDPVPTAAGVPNSSDELWTLCLYYGVSSCILPGAAFDG